MLVLVIQDFDLEVSLADSSLQDSFELRSIMYEEENQGRISRSQFLEMVNFPSCQECTTFDLFPFREAYDLPLIDW